MKTKLILTGIAFFGVMFASKAQTSNEVIVRSPINQVISGNVVTPTSDGFKVEGNVTFRAATPGELNQPDADVSRGCGFWGNWVCGRPTIVTDPNYPLTWIKCEGETGKCAKIASAL